MAKKNFTGPLIAVGGSGAMYGFLTNNASKSNSIRDSRNVSECNKIFTNKYLCEKLITFFNEFVNSERWKTIYNAITNSNNYMLAAFDTGEKCSAMTPNLKEIIYNNIIDESSNMYVYVVNNETDEDENEVVIELKHYRDIINALYNAYGDAKTKYEDSEPDFTKSDISDGYRLSLYNSLKNLYDKWANSYTVNNFMLRSPQDDLNTKIDRYQNGVSYDSSKISNKCEFDNFMFVDCYYNDISYKFKMNPNSIMDIVLRQIQAESNYSIYEFMAELMQKNKMLLQALPVYSNFYSFDEIDEIFTPSIRKTMKMGLGSTYVGMYTYEVSHVVDDNRFDDHLDSDYLVLTDLNGITEDPKPNTVSGRLFNYNGEGLSIPVPAFGVTYARQNQSYFKNIDVNMDNPRITDYSIANLFALTNSKNGNDLSHPLTVANDIYSIYANRSYNCSVDMLGCANIMPMMYFQLNNIPMFRGAYMISNVEHHISAGQFTTRFSGVRISKNQIPYNDNLFNYDNSLDYKNGGEYGLTESPISNINGGKYSADCSELNIDNIKSAMTHKMCNRSGSKCATGGPYNATSGGGWCATAVSKFIAAGLGYTGKQIDGVRIGNGVACAGFVKEHGGRIYDGSIADINSRAKSKWENTGSGSLYSFGFELITILPAGMTRKQRQQWTAENCIAGDVACMYRGSYNYLDTITSGNSSGKPAYGHVCMYSGEKWVSDFGQVDMYVYGSDANRVNPKEIYIFRHAGCKAKENTNPPMGGYPKAKTYNTGNRSTGEYPFRIFNISRNNCGVNKLPSSLTNIIQYSDLKQDYLNSLDDKAKEACRRYTTHKDATSACVMFIYYIKCRYLDRGLKTVSEIIKTYNAASGWKQYVSDVCAYMTRKLGKDIKPDSVIIYNKEYMCALGEIVGMHEQSINVSSYMPTAWEKVKGY